MGRLLERQRERIGAGVPTKHCWGYESDVQLLGTQNIYGDRTIFPFHDRLQLGDADAERTQRLLTRQRENCTQLHWVARNDLAMRSPLQCELCQILLSRAPEVRMHLFSRLHMDRERAIGFERD